MFFRKKNSKEKELEGKISKLKDEVKKNKKLIYDLNKNNKKLIDKLNNKEVSINVDTSDNFINRLKFFFYRIMRYKMINVIFVKDNKEVSFKTIKYDKYKSLNIEDKSFIFNPESFYFYGNSPILIYYENQINPIHFSKEEEIRNDPATLKKILEYKILEEVLKSGGLSLANMVNEKTLMYLVVIVIGIILWSQGFFNEMI